jgi:hypothetical protein
MSFLALFTVSCLLAAGCGGGGSGGGGGGGGGAVAEGYSVTLSWEAPTTNADGSPLSDLGGFRIYRRTAQGTYKFAAETGTQTNFTLRSLPEGAHFFKVSAYDFSGNESVVSDETSIILPRPEDTQP